MMDHNCYNEIIALIKREVIPAIGCTEPIAVALAVAKAKEVLGKTPESISVYLSPNMLKNAMGVGIPSTDRTGLPIAVALGVVVGKSTYGLEVLKDSTADKVNEAIYYMDHHVIDILLKKGNIDKLYIEVEAKFGSESALVVIEKLHTNFTHISKNGVEQKILHIEEEDVYKEEKPSLKLNMRLVYDFAMEVPLADAAFILEAGRLNKSAAEISLKGHYGHGLGSLLHTHTNMMGNNVLSKTLSYTSAACDARMAGAMIPVMSNSGSGNQGISATLPVVVYAEETKASEESLIRALILSHLTVIYIKQSLGRLSALCGCVVAATGSSCGITYLMGGKYEQVSYAVQNMIANITGMICDGAKPSCSLKVTTGVSTALLSAMMAIENKCVSSIEGIIDEDVDKTILNLTRIGCEGMSKTDELVLDIMINKC